MTDNYNDTLPCGCCACCGCDCDRDTEYEHIFPEPPELNYCPRCGSDSVYQSQSNGAMKCEKCGLECHVIEEVDEG